MFLSILTLALLISYSLLEISWANLIDYGFGLDQGFDSYLSRNSLQSQRYILGDLIFEDHFDKLDETIWQNEINMNGGGNGEFQIYNNSRDNSFIRNGKLFIKPTLTADKFGEDFLFNGTIKLENCTDEFGCSDCCVKTANGSKILNPVISARLRTKKSFSFKYGRFEVRAKLPSADWTWPAVWLLPKTNARYGNHPRCGEIDLIESRGNELLFVDDVNIGSEQIASCLHFGPKVGIDGYRKTLYKANTLPGLGFDKEFHIFAFEWTPESFKFELDGVDLGTIRPHSGGFFELGQFSKNETNPWINAENFRMAPFDQEFYIILNVAVGGNTFFPDNSYGLYPKPWRNKEPNSFLNFWNGKPSWYRSWFRDRAALQIDYIKIWDIIDTLDK